ncbi:hypothetical protein [Lactobacillus xujianguonis]|uniref:hypothetical protein n=1 Tax=Lactobacillus xujianguonis TaxID=2495899 RepID=UPI000FDA0EE5|nr:hypothetical protein [Lactobacillus xujianguonis]RVU73514.1 hypothetical protein EJK20_07725 [Lactobacillus xujianguonis]
MYHKQPDQQDKTLAEWTKETNAASPPDKHGGIIGWVHHKTAPVVVPKQEVPIGTRRKRMEVSYMYLQRALAQEKEDAKEFKNMVKATQLIDKLEAEKNEYIDKTLKIDDKIISPTGISDTQVKLLSVERNALRTLTNVVDMRIDDLKEQD